LAASGRGVTLWTFDLGYCARRGRSCITRVARCRGPVRREFFDANADRRHEAGREKRAKIINAEGESLAAAALGEASDTMMAHPLALQLWNLQSLVEIGVDKNTTVVFPAPTMSTIEELGSFLAREKAASTQPAAARAAVPGARCCWRRGHGPVSSHGGRGSAC
jgi:hypothetical protein